MSLHRSDENRWKIRQELDMLSRFTGHDQWDKYTKNWLRQHAARRTFYIPEKERIQTIRIMDNRRLAVLSDGRRWEVDLSNGQVLFQHNLRRDRSYALSSDGRRLYCTYHDPVSGHHIIECNGKPMFITEPYPYFVSEGPDGGVVTVGLGSEHSLLGHLDAYGNLARMERLDMQDVALASVALGGTVFSGLLSGALHVYNGQGPEKVHVLRRQSDRVPSSVRCMDVESMGAGFCVYMGSQDGFVRVCRVDSGSIHEFSSRRVHRGPVTQIRCHSARIVSTDDEGNVLVSDMNGSKTFYSLSFDGPTSVDISRRMLAVGHGNALHVWDHDHPDLRDTKLYDLIRGRMAIQNAVLKMAVLTVHPGSPMTHITRQPCGCVLAAIHDRPFVHTYCGNHLPRPWTQFNVATAACSDATLFLWVGAGMLLSFLGILFLSSCAKN